MSASDMSLKKLFDILENQNVVRTELSNAVQWKSVSSVVQLSIEQDNALVQELRKIITEDGVDTPVLDQLFDARVMGVYFDGPRMIFENLAAQSSISISSEEAMSLASDIEIKAAPSTLDATAIVRRREEGVESLSSKNTIGSF